MSGPPPPPTSMAGPSSNPTAAASPLFQAFPQTQALSREDLQDLLTDEMYHQAFVGTLPEVKDLLEECDRIERENEALAERNLSLQPGLARLRSETAAAFSEAQELKARWGDLDKQQAALYQRYSEQFLHMRLRHSLSQQDDYSESLASSFIEGTRTGSPVALDASGNQVAGTSDKGSLEEFVRDFKAARKVYHKRAIWSERWNRGEVAWRD